MSLLDYGFNNYKIEILKTTDDIVKEIRLGKATSSKISLVPLNDIAILSKKSADTKKYTYDIKVTNNNLPLKIGDEVGKIIVKDSDNNKVKEEVLTVTENVDKLNFLDVYKRQILLLENILISGKIIIMLMNIMMHTLIIILVKMDFHIVMRLI